MLGVVTGKPLAIGGSLGRNEATARGALYCIQQMCQKQGSRSVSCRVAIQGFGNVGLNLATLLAKEGVKVVAVSDSRSGLYNADGLDIRRRRAQGGARRGRRAARAPTRSRTRSWSCSTATCSRRARSSR